MKQGNTPLTIRRTSLGSYAHSILKTVQPNPRFYPVLLPAHGFRPAKMPMLGMIILQPLRHGTKPPLPEALFMPCPHCIQQWKIPTAILRFHVHFPSWRDQAEARSYRTTLSGHPVVGRTLELQKQRYITPGILFQPKRQAISSWRSRRSSVT